MNILNKLKKSISDNLVETAVDSIVSNIGKGKEKDSSSQKKKLPDKKNLPEMNQASAWSDELEYMVKVMIEDDTLSDKELSLLKKRAEREGINPEDFEFDLQLRIRQYKREIELKANLSPVEALSQAFNMLENYAKGGKKVVDGGALSGILALVPGVGQAAAVGGLLAEFIETPSNLNNLKAEAIRRFVLPERGDYLRDFIQYAGSQLEEEVVKKESGISVKRLISSLTVGDELDICPIWENKIEDACSLSILRYPNDSELMAAVKRYRPTLSNKLRQGRIRTFSGLPAPTDDEDLLNAIAFFYDKRNDQDFWAEAKDVYKRLYSDAEVRFDSKPELKNQLRNYKVKLFGLF